MQIRRIVLGKKPSVPQLFDEEPPTPKLRVRKPVDAAPVSASRVRKITVQARAAPEPSSEQQLICQAGEIDVSRRPDLWVGWPNGSCVNRRGGTPHLGRILEVNRMHQVLRFNPMRRTYLYVGQFGTFLEAWSALTA